MTQRVGKSLIGPNDRLSPLPIELLEHIFDLAFASHAPTGPLSRTLLPLDRFDRFYAVRIQTTDHLERFYRTFVDSEDGDLPCNPILAGYVRSLHVQTHVERDRLPGEAPMLHSGKLARMLKALKRLTHLLVGDDRVTTNLILSPSFARCCSPTLENLFLVLPAELDRPFEPLHFSHFSSLPALKNLQLDGRWCGLSVPSFSPPPTLPHFETLRLTAAFEDHFTLSRFVGACTGLKKLDLTDSTQTPDYVPFLALLPPSLRTTLTSLSLHTDLFDSDDSPTSSCAPLLPCFQNLTHLHLDDSTYSSLPDLASSLLTLPHLSSLTLGENAPVTKPFLLSLLSGSSRLPALKTLVVNHFMRAEMGWRINVDGGGTGRLHKEHGEYDEEDDLGESHVGPGWFVPVCKRSEEDYQIDLEEMDEVVSVGAANGVVVKGTSVDALGVLRAYQLEAKLCWIEFLALEGERNDEGISYEAMVGHFEGDEDVAREVFRRKGRGREVEEALARRTRLG